MDSAKNLFIFDRYSAKVITIAYSKKTPGSVSRRTFLGAILDNKHLLWKVSKESRAETMWAGSMQWRRGSCCQALFCLFYSAASSSPVLTNWCIAPFSSLNAPCDVSSMHVYLRTFWSLMDFLSHTHSIDKVGRVNVSRYKSNILLHHFSFTYS